MINNLPNGWREEKFRNVFTFKSKSKIKASEGKERGIYPFYTSSQKLSKFLNEYVYDLNNGLVFGTGGLPSIHYVENKFATSTDCFTVENTLKDINTKYIYNFLKGNIYILEYGFQGAGLKHISKKYIENISLPIPPLQQQEKIVKVLDLTSNLIEKQKKLLEKYDLFLKSKFIEMFGDPYINPKNWNIEKFEQYLDYIGDIGSNGSNAVISKNLKMLDKEDYALMVRTVNLNKNDFTEDVKYVSKETYDFFKKSKIYGGEIIMNKIGSAGKFWKMPYLNRPVSLGLNQLVIRLKNLNTEYLYYLLSTDYGQIVINSKTNGAVTKSITKGAIKDIDIMVPPIELQNKFASIVEKIETIKEKENQKLKQLEDLHNSLMQKAFKGEIE